MDVSDYTRYGDYRCDLVLDTMAVAVASDALVAAVAVVAADTVFECSTFSMYDYRHVKSAIDSGDN